MVGLVRGQVAGPSYPLQRDIATALVPGLMPSEPGTSRGALPRSPIGSARPAVENPRPTTQAALVDEEGREGPAARLNPSLQASRCVAGLRDLSAVRAVVPTMGRLLAEVA